MQTLRYTLPAVLAVLLLAGAGALSQIEPEVQGPVGGGAATPLVPVTGQGEAGVLRIDAQDGRYFTRDGEFWYLAGYYPTIAALTADQTDYDTYYREFIDLLAENNLNYFRNVFNMGQPYGEARTVYERTGPGSAADGQPRFDLTRIDPEYFDYWRKVIAYAGEKGVVVQLVIFDSWHNKQQVTWRSSSGRVWGMKYDFYCGENNINGIDACTPRQWHNPRHPVFDVQKALVRRVVDELGDLPNIVWEISNENYTNEDWELQLAGYLSEYEASRGFPRKLVIPRDLPNHDGAGGKENATGQVFREISANSRLGKPLIADNDGGGHAGPEGRRKKAWVALTAGGHVNYFHAGMYDPEVLRSADVRRGMFYIGLTRKFLEDFSIDLRGMGDCRRQVTRGYCLGTAGERYVVYLETGGKVQVSQMPPEPEAYWFDPRTGESRPAKWSAGRGGAAFAAPDAQDWVLYITGSKG